MNYEEMSDFEINKLVAKKVFDSHEWVCVNSWSDGEFIASLVNYTQEKFDPCNDPSDAWPIIVGSKITISPQSNGDEWEACAVMNDELRFEFEVWDKNPLRAAMICFLKMKNSEQ